MAYVGCGFYGLTVGGTASNNSLTRSDERRFDEYDLAYIYNLKTSGLKAPGNIVTFDLGSTYYAYNAKGEYIGTTRGALPYWTKYYLTTTKYDFILAS